MTFIYTFAGHKLDFLDPDPSMICIDDIAIGLSTEARFGGHTRFPYYVSQHSIGCSHLVAPEFALEALLHDATEAYMRDIPTPLKMLLPEYQKIEDRLDKVIRKVFGLAPEMSRSVKEVDSIALYTEMHKMTYMEPKHPAHPGYLSSIKSIPPAEAYTNFLRRFHELYQKDSAKEPV